MFYCFGNIDNIGQKLPGFSLKPVELMIMWQSDVNNSKSKRRTMLDEIGRMERAGICVHLQIIFAVIAFSLVHVEHVSSCYTCFIKSSIIVIMSSHSLHHILHPKMSMWGG